MRGSLSLFAGACCLAACARPAPNDPAAARASLRQADSAYAQAGAAKDRDAFVGLYASDAVMYPPAEPTVTGVDAIGKFVDGFLRDTAFAAVFRPLDVQVSADGTMGHTLNSGELTYTGPDGKLVTEHIRDFHVWRREAGGSWRLTIDIWNAEPATVTAKN